MITGPHAQPPPAQPIVFIIGTTGTGKSDLAVHLAKTFNGEVINADAMQIYSGLPIVTNKMNDAERAGIVHHIFDQVDPFDGLRSSSLSNDYRVNEFQRDAEKAIRSIQSRNRLPIVAGGSLYYVESLLWELLIPNVTTDTVDAAHAEGATADNTISKAPALLPLSFILDTTTATIPLTTEAVANIASAELYKTLVHIDPEQAEFTHPNDKRKILRSLEIYFQHGKKHSVLLDERQRSVPGGSSISGPLLRPQALILWLQCADEEELHKRLDDRVDTMIQRGLVGELRQFHAEYNRNCIAHGLPANVRDYERGIFQSIGFKEFHEYLLLQQQPDDTDEDDDESKKSKLWIAAVDQMKRRTRRYARTQLQWINNRMLRRPDRQLPCIYGLDVSDRKSWSSFVLPRAQELVAAYLSGHHDISAASERVLQSTSQSTSTSTDSTFAALDMKNYVCDVCGGRTMRGKQQYEEHLASKSHRYCRRRLSRANKASKRLQNLASDGVVVSKSAT